MLSIVLLGTGNVATKLFNVFSKHKELQVVQVLGRSAEALAPFGAKTATSMDFSTLLQADLYVLAVSDDAIAHVSGTLPPVKGLVVHTSGSIPLSALHSHERRGVFYPLQTFSKDVGVNFSPIPICLEAQSSRDLQLLEQLGGCISDRVLEVSSEQRLSLHLAAVFANNFTNHLYHVGSEICNAHQLPFQLLQPLIMETVRKIGNIAPYDAQTGPARRKDQGTMDKHMKLLTNPTQKEIYSFLSQSIKETYGEKL
ncbi:DUF2520 domain-containing protein [Flavobacteriaceae bacterium 3-367]